MKFSARQAREPGQEMPEQDPEIARLNAELEIEREASERTALTSLATAAFVATGVIGLLVFFRRRQAKKEQ